MTKKQRILHKELGYDKNNVLHVSPENDLIKHNTNSPDCECNPKLELQDNGALLVIHKSYDGRELKEQNVKAN